MPAWFLNDIVKELDWRWAKNSINKFYKKLYQSRISEELIEEYNLINKKEIERILKEKTIKPIESQKLDNVP